MTASPDPTRSARSSARSALAWVRGSEWAPARGSASGSRWGSPRPRPWPKPIRQRRRRVFATRQQEEGERDGGHHGDGDDREADRSREAGDAAGAGLGAHGLVSWKDLLPPSRGEAAALSGDRRDSTSRTFRQPRNATQEPVGPDPRGDPARRLPRGARWRAVGRIGPPVVSRMALEPREAPLNDGGRNECHQVTDDSHDRRHPGRGSMTTDPVVVESDAPATDAERQLKTLRVGCLPTRRAAASRRLISTLSNALRWPR